jgi:sec-independent protein translocase protein TatA
MGTWGIGHWLVVLVVAVLVFGSKKIGTLGGDLASAIKNFKKGMQDDDHGQQQLKADPNPSAQAGADSKRENTP